MASSLLSPLAREGLDDDSDHWDELAARIIPRNGRARVDGGGSERVSKGTPQGYGPHCVFDSRATEQRYLNFFEWSRTMTRHAVVNGFSPVLIDVERRLSEWESRRSFDTVGKCQAYLN